MSVPDQPPPPTLSARTSNSLTATWPLDPLAVSYSLVVEDAAGAFTTIDPAFPGSVVGGLPANSGFRLRLIAKNADGSAPPSADTIAWTNPPKPLGQAILFASPIDGSIIVGWDFAAQLATLPNSGGLQVIIGRSSSPVAAKVEVGSSTHHSGVFIEGLAPLGDVFYFLFLRIPNADVAGGYNESEWSAPAFLFHSFVDPSTLPTWMPTRDQLLRTASVASVAYIPRDDGGDAGGDGGGGRGDGGEGGGGEGGGGEGGGKPVEMPWGPEKVGPDGIETPWGPVQDITVTRDDFGNVLGVKYVKDGWEYDRTPEPKYVSGDPGRWVMGWSDPINRGKADDLSSSDGKGPNAENPQDIAKPEQATKPDPSTRPPNPAPNERPPRPERPEHPDPIDRDPRERRANAPRSGRRSDIERIIESALDHVLKNEGGYSDRANDRGGPTNRGITIGTLRRIYPGSTIHDLKALTKQQARDIYRQYYILGPGLNRLPTGIMPQAIDINVNSGPTNAIRILQRALNTLGYGPVAEDGLLGPGTIAASERASQADPGALNNAIADQREAFYHRLVERIPKQREFLRGWIRRAEGFRVGPPRTQQRRAR